MSSREPRPPSDETRFRRWLIDRLVESKWVTGRGEDPAALAKRLGVDPSVITAAQAELRQRSQASGVIMPKLGKPDNYRQKNVNVRICELTFAELPWADWRGYCTAQALTDSVALRSLVHTLLSGPANPQWLGRSWGYKGRILKLKGYKGGQKWPWVAKCEITKGAEAALVRRAQVLGVTPTALVRGQAIELLEGRIERLLLATTPRAMWDNPEKYWTLDVKNVVIGS